MSTTTGSNEDQTRPTIEDIIDESRQILREVAVDALADVVVSIPIWGWWGDGKTTTLLTLLGACDETRHGITIRLLNDTDELADLETKHQEYRELSLVEVANSTRADLQEKLVQFMDECLWPVGTDAPTPYVFGLSGVMSDLGFLYMPDLPGGSFQGAEEAAKAVLSRAHGAIILVDPERYLSGGAEGKNYKDEVHTRLRKCYRAKIPTAILITKADRDSMRPSADETFSALSILIKHYPEKLFHLASVSVIGLGLDRSADDDGRTPQLPPPRERSPEHLIGAFLWLLARIFEKQSSQQLRTKIPAVRMKRLNAATFRTSRKTIPEFRSLGQFSGLSGLVKCCLPKVAGRERMLVGTVEGLVELSFVVDSGVSHSQANLGFWELGEVDPSELDVYYCDGRVFAGRRRNAGSIWRGQLGDDLTEEHFPLDLVAWAPVTADRVVGIGPSRRLHSFVLKAGEWGISSFVPNFITGNGEYVQLWVSPRKDEVLAFSGQDVVGVRLSTSSFDERIAENGKFVFDEDTCIVNRVGMAASIDSDGKLHVYQDGTTAQVATTNFIDRDVMALANSRPTIAYMAEQNKLRGARFIDQTIQEVIASGDDFSGELESICWTHNDKYIVTSFENGAWGLWEAVGVHV